MHDSRVLIADKLGFTSSRLTEGKKSPFATIGAAQLERWRSSQTQQTISTENTFLRPLAEELAVLCGAKPHLIDSLTHRKFEELIASLFHNHEFDVHLTAATRDGGYDIVAVSHTGLLKETILVEVKHFAPNRPVGVGIVRALYGVKSLHGASKAILATSSYVSRDACHEFSRVIPWEIDFVNREQILSWCEDYLEVLLKNEDDQETEPG